MTDEVHRYAGQVSLSTVIPVNVEGLDGGRYVKQIHHTLAQVISAIHHVQRIDEQAAGGNVSQFGFHWLKLRIGRITKVPFTEVVR